MQIIRRERADPGLFGSSLAERVARLRRWGLRNRSRQHPTRHLAVRKNHSVSLPEEQAFELFTSCPKRLLPCGKHARCPQAELRLTRDGFEQKAQRFRASMNAGRSAIQLDSRLTSPRRAAWGQRSDAEIPVSDLCVQRGHRAGPDIGAAYAMSPVGAPCRPDHRRAFRS